MVLSEINALRARIADRPTFHHREVGQEESGGTTFRLDHHNIVDAPALIVRVNGATVPDTDYTLDTANGIVTFDTAPSVNSEIVFEYTSVVWTDEELQDFLDEAGSITLAAANVLLAWAADFAKLAYRESLAGGGGMGSVTIGLDNRAKEMRETARAYFENYQKYENVGVAAEGLTEVAWTQHMTDRMIVNDMLEDMP